MSKKKHEEPIEETVGELPPETPAVPVAEDVTGPNGAHAEAKPDAEPVERRETHSIPEISVEERDVKLSGVRASLEQAHAVLKTIPGERAAKCLNKLGETLGALR